MMPPVRFNARLFICVVVFTAVGGNASRQERAPDVALATTTSATSLGNATTVGYIYGDTNSPVICLAEWTPVSGTTPSAAFGCCFTGDQCPGYYSTCITSGATVTPTSESCTYRCPYVLTCSSTQKCLTYVKTTAPNDPLPLVSFLCLGEEKVVPISGVATPFAAIPPSTAAETGLTSATASSGAGLTVPTSSPTLAVQSASGTDAVGGQPNNDNKTTIIASVVPTVFVLSLLGLGIFFFLRRRHRQAKPKADAGIPLEQKRSPTTDSMSKREGSTLFQRPSLESQTLAHQRRLEYKIALFCAIGIESNSIINAMDAKLDDFGRSNQAYTTGIFAGRKVVLVWLSDSGQTSSGISAALLKKDFAAIELALVIGVCGGVPQPKCQQQEIFLGDLIISTATVTGDYGRQLTDGFERYPHTLQRPRHEVRVQLKKFASEEYRRRIREGIIADLHTKSQSSLLKDDLFDPTYSHQIPSSSTCQSCSRDKIIRTNTTTPLEPQVHFGLVASGNTLMRSATHRDEIALKENIIAFEMEGAAVAELYDTIVVKAVCDYADSHKNKVWQPFAADVATAGARALLAMWPVGR